MSKVGIFFIALSIVSAVVIVFFRQFMDKDSYEIKLPKDGAPTQDPLLKQAKKIMGTGWGYFKMAFIPLVVLGAGVLYTWWPETTNDAWVRAKKNYVFVITVAITILLFWISLKKMSGSSQLDLSDLVAVLKGIAVTGLIVAGMLWLMAASYRMAYGPSMSRTYVSDTPEQPSEFVQTGTWAIDALALDMAHRNWSPWIKYHPGYVTHWKTDPTKDGLWYQRGIMDGKDVKVTSDPLLTTPGESLHFTTGEAVRIAGNSVPVGIEVSRRQN